ncbi:MAG TPA: ABC transporter ATP-binding protein [Burkholderiales bacterium]|nr:ABC transporter ATP-binding protein [Burkholderiales bacterium]
MLRCTDLTLEVPGRVLCRSLSVTFGKGQAWAVLGRNGTGKTTLIHALAGLAAPAAGRVELDGKPIADHSPRERARRSSVLLQIEPGAYWGTAAEYVVLGRHPHGAALAGYTRADEDAARAALDAVGMAAFADRAFATLSGGERQRVRIAQMLVQEAASMLLDEPLQHLDLAHQAHVLKLVSSRVSERDETAIMVLHEPMWLGRCCTHALVLFGDGTAATGAAGDVLTRENLERAYGCALVEIGAGAQRCFLPHV